MRYLRSLASLKLFNGKNLMKSNMIVNNQSLRFYGAPSGNPKLIIQERVLDLLKDFDKVDQGLLTAEAHLTKDLKLDSLDTVEVIMAVEEEFSIEIPEHDSVEIKTVKDVIEYISLRNDAV
ncbi:acyl carrier protein [Neoconidiobolus thromboides FSU 785]|nr:acyl carrier protein [Neoconidiobolus thromboides FSU 785]